MTLSVLIVDRHPVVRNGLRAWLGGPDFDVVGDVATAGDAIELVSRRRPDVVITEGQLSDSGGAALCSAILERHPDTAVIVYAGDFDEESVVAAADAGARAYLLKDAPEPNLADVVRRVAAGERCVDPAVAAALFHAQGRTARQRLTGQELSVVRLAAQGYTNREIGARLYLSRHTVKEYLSHAMRKLEVDSRVAAVVEAGRRGLLGPLSLPKAS
jgi:DNA-binding NarL/FixJ family response regulator